jgi:hypothetical protein
MNQLRYSAPAAGMAVAAALCTSPVSAATPDQHSCSGGAVCESPGNAQINATPPVAGGGPRYQYPFWRDAFIGGPGFAGWGYGAGQDWGYGASDGWGSFAGH